MPDLVELTISGVLSAAYLSLAAIGLMMTFGTLRIPIS
jgi:branched-subunit amino acid ABC-type transport system permease component